MDNSIPLPIPKEDWPSELAHIVQDMSGNPINVHKLMANNPVLLNAWWSFRNYAVHGATLGQRRTELLILRVGVQMQSWYEWASHVARAMNIGIKQEDIFAVLKPVACHAWAEDERALLTATDELTSMHKISPSTLTQLNAHLGSEQIMDIIAIHGMYLFLAGMMRTWGLTLDEHIQEKISGITDEESFLKQANLFADTSH